MSKLKLTSQNLITAVLFGVLGILLIVLRMGMLNVLLTIIGVLLLAVGIYDIVMNLSRRTNTLVRGIIETLVGVVIIVCGWTIAQWTLIIFGVLLVILGVVGSVKYLQNHRHNVTLLVENILMVVIGVILCIAPFAIGDIICLIVGLLCLVNAVLALFGKTIA